MDQCNDYAQGSQELINDLCNFRIRVLSLHFV